MGAKHTPGPWVVDRNGEQLRVWKQIGIRERYGVADICINRTMGNREPSALEEANARLIAAAPELLACLKRGIDLCERGHGQEWADEAREAIAKAEGTDGS